jgi:hypothetical protein
MPHPRLPIRSASIEQRTSCPDASFGLVKSDRETEGIRIAGARSLNNVGSGPRDVVFGNGLNTGSGKQAAILDDDRVIAWLHQRRDVDNRWGV